MSLKNFFISSFLAVEKGLHTSKLDSVINAQFDLRQIYFMTETPSNKFIIKQ